MTHDERYLNNYSPCCLAPTDKLNATTWKCRRCGALSDSDEWNDALKELLDALTKATSTREES